MDEAGGLQVGDVRRLVGRVGDDQVDVDHRLGRQPSHRRRPDVVELEHAVAEGGPRTAAATRSKSAGQRVVVLHDPDLVGAGPRPGNQGSAPGGSS